MPRRYADGTSVSVLKSRTEIDALLQRWGASACSWTDDWGTGRTRLEFVWHRNGLDYHARFEIKLPDDEDLREEARHARTREVLESKLERLRAARGRQEHRRLLLWLKATFEAVEDGIVEADAVFLPFLVGKDGRTFAEHALPNLPKLLEGAATRLLPEPMENVR